MKIIVLILFLSKVFCSIQAAKSSAEIDATNALNDSIARIFQTVKSQNITKLIDTLLVYSDPADSCATTPYKYNYIWCNGDESEMQIFNIRLINASSKNAYVSIGFLNNEIKLYCPQMTVHLSGNMYISGLSKPNYTFNSVAHFNGYAITTTRQPNNSDNSWLIDSQHDNADIKFGLSNDEEWENLHKNIQRLRFVPLILRTTLNRNNEFKQAIGEIFDNLSTKDFISKHPHFSSHEHLYHYRISNISFGSLNLKDIIVRGLWNYHSLKYTLNNDTVTYCLLMKNIRGSMLLEDASRTAPVSLKFHYIVDSLSIFVTQEINIISVKAEKYSIVEIDSNFRSRQLLSDILMDQIERAIGSSLMPSMKYQQIERSLTAVRPLLLETLIRNALIEVFINSTPATSRKPHTNSTSFDDSTTAINQISCSEKPTKITYNYHISFRDPTINFIMGNPGNADGIQCPLPANSKFTHQINVAPSGNPTLKNNPANTIDLNFHFDYPTVNVSFVNPTVGNDSCKFQMRNTRNFQVELSPPADIVGSSEQLWMKKKIDAVLMSMTKDRIVRTVKPIVCSSLEVCRQTVKIINSYCQKFIDILLKKCSLQRIKT